MKLFDKLFFGAMAKFFAGRNFLYNKIYEKMSEGMRKSLALIPADDDDMKLMLPDDNYTIYTHIPFCKTICKECPYNKTTKLHLMDDYTDHLVKEIEIVKDSAKGDIQPPQAVFFGGGTPSLLPLKNMERIMALLNTYFIQNSDVEVTLEVSPQSTTREKIDAWRKMGINRISMGIQSFKKEDLKYYNRSKQEVENSEELCNI
jgi:coproporphyrinogen III oxidase-like Fe-S oxidoreductase